VKCAGYALRDEESEALRHVESKLVAFGPLDRIIVVVDELAQRTIAGLLEEKGGYLSCCGRSVGEVAI
jgi:hypothetical protein